MLTKSSLTPRPGNKPDSHFVMGRKTLVMIETFSKNSKRLPNMICIFGYLAFCDFKFKVFKYM